MTNLVINVKDEEVDEARIYAKEEGIKISHIVKKAIRDYNEMHRRKRSAAEAMQTINTIRGKLCGLVDGRMPTRDEMNER